MVYHYLDNHKYKFILSTKVTKKNKKKEIDFYGKIFNVIFVGIIVILTPVTISAHNKISNNKLLIIVEDNTVVDEEFISEFSSYLDIVKYSDIYNYEIRDYGAYAIDKKMLKEDLKIRQIIKDAYYNSDSIIYLYGEDLSIIGVKDIFELEQLTYYMDIYDVNEDTTNKALVSIESDSNFNIISVSKIPGKNFIASIYRDFTLFSAASEYIKIIIENYIELTYEFKTLNYDIVDDGYNIRAYYNDNYYNVNYILYKAHDSSTNYDYFGLLTYVSPYVTRSSVKASEINIKHDYIQVNNHILEAQPASTVNATTLSCQVSLNGPSIGFSYEVSGEPTVDRVYNIHDNNVQWKTRKSKYGDYLNDSYFVFGSSHSVLNELAEARINVAFSGYFITWWGTGWPYSTPKIEFTISYRYCDNNFPNSISHNLGPYTPNVSHHSAICTHCSFSITEPHKWVHTSLQTYCSVCNYVSDIQPWNNQLTLSAKSDFEVNKCCQYSK